MKPFSVLFHVGCIFCHSLPRLHDKCFSEPEDTETNSPGAHWDICTTALSSAALTAALETAQAKPVVGKLFDW